MLNIEIDGKQFQVPPGTTVIQAANQAGIYIPHFCYHKKLSIAASCRMCLVQVEKAPKPLPACATTVADGMKVFTHSELAVKAQKGVMEFLLINHPLDCPICDQAGECRLQDLSVGYGGTNARYQEEKRVVPNKDLGPLVVGNMTRCINCTRCVRFLQEIAGYQEMGQAFRGDRAEIMPFLGRTIDSELSGNIIDLCPVGSLTSKPFRYTARSWELARRPSIAPHDGLGSNVVVHVKNDRVYRVTPRENEAINECWLSDRDRFSYEGLNSADRLTKPMVKQGGVWKEVEWNQALDYASHALSGVAKEHGSAAVGALVSPAATLEEMALAAKLMRGLGSENIDFRLRQRDFSADGKRAGTPWLGMKVADLDALNRVLLVGANLRREHPLVAWRLRKSKAAVVQVSQPAELQALINAGDTAFDGILLGNQAQQHPGAATLAALSQQLAERLGAKVGWLVADANGVGGYVAKAVPGEGGLNAAAMISDPRKAYLVLGAEPELDCADGAAALAAMKQAQSVVVLTSFKSAAMLDTADCLLPVSPFTETSGTFINMEGRVQGFAAAVRPLGETRPAWKVLRVLGNLLRLDGFGQESSEDVRNEVLGGASEFVPGLDNTVSGVAIDLSDGAQAVAVPMYAVDPLVRRAASLQRTGIAREKV
ncbi:MAG: NADH-quinone oxidoreductase subunit NuoG [Candidatus Nitricoxidivorans perseverans]|uniref:NADH-quinone oxidoreductase subunit NuoG n=1 Tax=Candidatus Nitricoxidivorans perseverans TaxID=2975601 RepID=A0AA49IVB0_9PROT|nr:MAG: NADH-quinone oxidoreductase subunit NuoG [Candidatus Nitricoxidivorans perseverans]